MKTAAAYLRVSDERQDEYSLDSQQKIIRDYALKNDYDLPPEFIFVEDGISGRKAEKRPAFMQMIGLAKSKPAPFDTILVWKFSRFARNQEESILYKSMLARSGISVVSVSEPIVDGPFGSLIERILEWMDEFYSIRLSGEVKRGMTERFSRGQPVSIAPFGYRYSEDGKSFLPDENADIIRDIFRSFLSGEGMRHIAMRLSHAGVRTCRGNPTDNRFIDYVLNNPVYIGKLRWSAEGHFASKRDYDSPDIMTVDGTHEPLIDMPTWEAVQAKLRAVKRQYSKYSRREAVNDWMLKGICRCNSCGATLVHMNSACPSMQCHNYSRGSCKVSHALSIAKANAAVTEALEKAVADLSFNLSPGSTRTPAAVDNAENIRRERLKLDRLQAAYEAGIDTLEEYAMKKKRVLDAISRLQAEEAAVPAPAVDLNAFAAKVSAVVNIIKSPDITQDAKNKALRTILEKIVYEKPSGELILYFYV